MRISSLQIFNNGINNIQNGQTQLAKLQEQISTGKNLNRPSDDPVAAAQILKFRRELAANETYSDNADVSKRRLELEEITIQQVKDAGDRLKELAIRGSNSTMNNQDRGAIATEAEQVQQFILGLMNTKDAQGEYLFAGAKGQTEPFVNDGQGNFSYQGDNEVRLIQTGPAAYVQSTDSGRAVFQTVPGDMEIALLNTSAAIGPLPGGFAIAMTAAALGENSEFQQYIEENGKQDLTLSLDLATSQYDLLDPNGASVLGGAVAIPAPVAPATTSVIEFNGLEIDTGVDGTAVVPGEVITTTIRPSQPRHSILTTAEKLITALQAPVTDTASREAMMAGVAEAMTEIDVAQAGHRSAQTELGGRMVSLQSQVAVNEDFSIFTQSALSVLEDLDYASAIAKFSFQEVALQAAQQTFSRVNNMTLFNYL
ncbi:MAG: flagellar hook-associated protein FlgL [Motiliproteus sp.]